MPSASRAERWSIQAAVTAARKRTRNWAAHSVLRRAMNHGEEPDVIRTRMLEVVRTVQHLPDGPDRAALDTYRDELAALGRTIEQLPAPALTQPGRSPALSPRQQAPSLEL